MKELICKCGGNLQKKDGFWICDSCKTKYVSDRDDDGNVFYYQPVEKSVVECGQIAPKASEIPINSVVTKEIKIDEDAETEVIKGSLDLSARELITNVKSYLSADAWEQAQNALNQVFLKSKTCAEAYWYQIWCDKHISSKNLLESKFSDFSQADANKLSSALDHASAIFAKEVMDLLFDIKYRNDNSCKNILSAIVPYTYDRKVYSLTEQNEKIEKSFEKAITSAYIESFEYLLNTLDSNDVDNYIGYLTRFAASSRCPNEYAQSCYRKILAVDLGNNEIRHKLIIKELEANALTNSLKNDFNDLVKYSANVDDDVLKIINVLVKDNTTTASKSEFMMFVLGYYSEELKELKTLLLKYAAILLESKLFALAKNYYYLVISFDKKNADAYWGLCLARIEAKNDANIVYCQELLMDCPEFNKYLSLVDEAQKKQGIDIGKKQIKFKQNKKMAIKAGGIIVGIVAIIIAIISIFNSLKYSEKNIEIAIIGKDDYVLTLDIKNSGFTDVTYFEGILKVYDGEAHCLVETHCDFSGNLISKDTQTCDLEISGDSDDYYIFRKLPMEELKITFQLTLVQYDDYKTKEYSNAKEITILKIDRKAAKALKEKHQKYIDQAIVDLDLATIDVANWEETFNDSLGIVDSAWDYFYSHKELLEPLYIKGKAYMQNEEHEKAYYVFDWLSSFDYKDSCILAEELYYNYYFSFGY